MSRRATTCQPVGELRKCQETLAGNTAPEFLNIAETPLFSRLTTDDLVAPNQLAQVEDFLRDRGFRFGREEHLDPRREQGLGLLLHHHADTPALQTHQRTHRVNAHSLDRKST